ncbi:hypothetical protein QRX60_45690 [Amycolatopsis mongoliensis]|uniref:Uncharacterized protein n=1 Tax=Amycolatopsis mongoliensis TaxID=715475 RepID=A0A9Y2NIY5_9PSEU|nr:hypothetical protein [Amycolatopsis sp. 4-36]WIY01248.1 hypothetical protein QRX60_45690 [Amycolatopsis sp. 4-36]
MVYDDDTYEPPHLFIPGSDHLADYDLAHITVDALYRVVELKNANPDWGSEDVFDQMLDEGHRIEHDDVAALFDAIGWDNGLGGDGIPVM